MDALIETFHIDFKFLLAQIINFAIVFGVLYFFALKPLLKIMKDRAKTVEKSLEDAKKIETNLAKAEEDYNKKIKKAKKNAAEILSKAGEDGEEKRQKMIKKAKEEIGQIIEQEKEQIRMEKARTLKEIKSEIADLIFVSLEKILEKKIDSKKDKELISKLLK